MFVPIVEPATSCWQELTAEVLWKLVDVLQPQDTPVSAFAPERYLSVFKRVCSHSQHAARKGLVLVQLPCVVHVRVATVILDQ